jgi:serine/threonine protein kinase
MVMVPSSCILFATWKAELDIPNVNLGKILQQTGYRAIYEGIYVPNQTPVIIESLDVKRGAPAVEIELLGKEAKGLGGLDHPNLPKVYAHGESDGYHYLVQDKASDLRLSDQMANGMYLPALEATRLTLDMATALEQIHKSGAVHGELRPSLILFTENEQVMIRRCFQRREDKNYLLEMFARRPEHLAPEQIRMEEPVLQSDHYALGLIYYQLLTGVYPFEGDSFKEVWKQHLEGALPILPAEISKIEGLESLFKKMLAKRPKKRHASDRDLIGDLEEIEDILMMSESDAMTLPVEEMTDDSEKELSRGDINRPVSSKPNLKKPISLTKSKKSKEKETRSSLGGASVQKKPKGRPSSKPTPGVKKRAPRQWKVNEASAAKNRGRGKSTSPAQTKKSLYLTGGLSALALLAIGVLGMSLMDSAKEAELQSQLAEKQEPGKRGPKLVIKSLKVLEAEKAGLLDENGALVDPDARQKAMESHQDLSKPKGEQLDLNQALTSEQSERAKKLGRIRELEANPTASSIQELENYFEDEDPQVRLVANQVYRDMKGGVLITDQELADVNLVETKLSILGEKSVASLLEHLDELRDSRSELTNGALETFLEHENREVRFKAFEVLRFRDPLLAFERGLNQFIELDLDSVSRYGVLEALGEWSSQDASVAIKRFLKASKEDIQSGFLHAVVPLLVEKAHLTVGDLKALMDIDPSLAFPIVSQVILRREVNGPNGVDLLLDILESDPKSTSVHLILSSLRMAKMSLQNIERLKIIQGKMIRDDRKYTDAILLGLGELDVGADEVMMDSEKAILMALEDLKESPSKKQLIYMSNHLGEVPLEMKEKILSALSEGGDEGVTLMVEILESRVDSETKKLVMKALPPHDLSYAALLAMIEDRGAKTEVVNVARLRYFGMGDGALAYLKKSDLSSKSKLELALGVDAQTALDLVLEIFLSADSREAKRMLSMLTDNGARGLELVDEVLAKHEDEDFLRSMLVALERIELPTGIQGTIELLKGSSTRVVKAAFDSLEDRLSGVDAQWFNILNLLKDEGQVLRVFDHIDQKNIDYENLIRIGVSDERDKVKIAAIETMIREKKPIVDAALVNLLVLETNSKVRQAVVKVLLTSLNEPHPVAMIWGVKNLSGSLKKKLTKALLEFSASVDNLMSLSLSLEEDYAKELKLEVVKFLKVREFNYFPSLYRSLDVDDADSVALFKEGVSLVKHHFTPSLLSKLNSEKSLATRRVIEDVLKDLKVQYKLDPKTGRYVLL